MQRAPGRSMPCVLDDDLGDRGGWQREGVVREEIGK